MTSEVKDTEHQRKTSPVYKFHDSLDIAINSINYHVEKHAARFELYQQKMQVEKALKEKRYDIKNTITVDEIQTKVTRIDMQSK
jgi:hypothetical protein